MTLRRVARPRLLDSPCLLENSRGCFREIALFPILLFFRFALRFGHVESCHRSTLREILKFKLTHYPGNHRRARAARISRSSRLATVAWRRADKIKTRCENFERENPYQVLSEDRKNNRRLDYQHRCVSVG